MKEELFTHYITEDPSKDLVKKRHENRKRKYVREAIEKALKREGFFRNLLPYADDRVAFKRVLKEEILSQLVEDYKINSDKDKERLRWENALIIDDVVNFEGLRKQVLNSKGSLDKKR